MPYTQHSYNSSTLNILIRTAGDPTALAGAVRRVAAEISRDVPLAFTTMEATVSKRVAAPRFRALLFGVFAGLAICLAMAGVYGVMAYAVEQRSKEIGLRMALGASKESVLRLILGQGLVLAAAGLAVGLAAALAATRLLATGAVRGPAHRRPGLSGSSRPARCGDTDRRLHSGAARGSHGSGGGSQSRVRTRVTFPGTRRAQCRSTHRQPGFRQWPSVRAASARRRRDRDGTCRSGSRAQGRPARATRGTAR